MRAKLLQVYWHERQPVYSLSFDHEGRLATAGGDNTIRVSVSGSIVFVYTLNVDLELQSQQSLSSGNKAPFVPEETPKSSKLRPVPSHRQAN